MASESLKEIQTRLLTRGYDLGPSKADGVWGGLTYKALDDLLTYSDVEAVEKARIEQARLNAFVPSTGETLIPVKGTVFVPGTSVQIDKASSGFALPPVIPNDWLMPAKMRGVVMHWTAGTNKVSAIDREHYHFIVDGDGDIAKGDHDISDNENTADDDYAAHTRGCNTGFIGISCAGMFGATESPLNFGAFPLNERQVLSMCLVVAQLARYYSFPITRKNVLTHAEVQSELGIVQRGKWDIAHLKYRPDLANAREVGDYLRAEIVKRL